MNCGVGHRHSSDPTLLWLGYRPAVVASIQPLAWELAYAAGVALKSKEKKKKKTVCENFSFGLSYFVDGFHL